MLERSIQKCFVEDFGEVVFLETDGWSAALDQFLNPPHCLLNRNQKLVKLNVESKIRDLRYGSSIKLLQMFQPADDRIPILVLPAHLLVPIEPFRGYEVELTSVYMINNS